MLIQLAPFRVRQNTVPVPNFARPLSLGARHYHASCGCQNHKLTVFVAPSRAIRGTNALLWRSQQQGGANTRMICPPLSAAKIRLSHNLTGNMRGQHLCTDLCIDPGSAPIRPRESVTDFVEGILVRSQPSASWSPRWQSVTSISLTCHRCLVLSRKSDSRDGSQTQTKARTTNHHRVARPQRLLSLYRITSKVHSYHRLTPVRHMAHGVNREVPTVTSATQYAERIPLVLAKAATVATVATVPKFDVRLGNYGTIPLPSGALRLLPWKSSRRKKSPQLFTAVGFLFYRELNSSSLNPMFLCPSYCHRN